MNPADFYQVQVELIGAVNGIFEIWIGFTFAVIVAVHLGTKSLNRVLLLIGLALYLTASTLFVFRFIALSNTFGAFNQMLLEMGAEPFPSGSTFRIQSLMLSIFILGSLSTVGYAIYRYKNRDNAI